MPSRFRRTPAASRAATRRMTLQSRRREIVGRAPPLSSRRQRSGRARISARPTARNRVAEIESAAATQTDIILIEAARSQIYPSARTGRFALPGMLDFSIYLLYRAGTVIAGLLPLRVLFVLGNFIGFAGWLLLPQYRRLARRNLEIAFADEKSPQDLRRICRRHFQRTAANFLCGTKLGSMSPEELAQYVEAENPDAVHQHLRVR